VDDFIAYLEPTGAINTIPMNDKTKISSPRYWLRIK